MAHHLKFFGMVVLCMAIANRISFVKGLTSEQNAPII